MTDLTSGWLAALKKMLQSTRQFGPSALLGHRYPVGVSV